MLTKGLGKVYTFVTKLLNFNLHEVLILIFSSYVLYFDILYIVRYSLNDNQDTDKPRLEKYPYFEQHTLLLSTSEFFVCTLSDFSVDWCDIEYPCVLSELQKIHVSLSVLPDRDLELESVLPLQATKHSLNSAYQQTFLKL